MNRIRALPLRVAVNGLRATGARATMRSVQVQRNIASAVRQTFCYFPILFAHQTPSAFLLPIYPHTTMQSNSPPRDISNPRTGHLLNQVLRHKRFLHEEETTSFLSMPGQISCWLKARGRMYGIRMIGNTWISVRESPLMP